MKRAMLILGIMLCTTVHAAKPALVVCYEDISNPPFYYSVKQTKQGLPGITIELLEQAARDNGMDLKLIQIPWKRCLKVLENNLVDGAFDLSFKASRESFAVYPYDSGVVDKERYLHELAYYLFTLKRSKITWDGEKIYNLKGKLAGVAGYSIVDDLRKAGYDVEDGRNQKTNLEMLVRGRIEGIAQFATTTRNIMRKNPSRYTQVRQHEIPLRSKLYYLAFSKEFYEKNTDLAEGIWDSLGKLNKSDFVEKRVGKYSQ